jgi:hypothetical protein
MANGEDKQNQLLQVLPKGTKNRGSEGISSPPAERQAQRGIPGVTKPGLVSGQTTPRETFQQSLRLKYPVTPEGYSTADVDRSGAVESPAISPTATPASPTLPKRDSVQDTGTTTMQNMAPATGAKEKAKQTGERIIYDKNKQPIITNRESGTLFDVKGKGGMTDEQIKSGDIRKLTALNKKPIQGQPTSGATLPKAGGIKPTGAPGTDQTLPEKPQYRGTGIDPKDIAAFDATQGKGGRNLFDINQPVTSEGTKQAYVQGGNFGSYGFGGTASEQAEQQKIADDRRAENMKILGQYLNPKSLAALGQEIDIASKQSEIAYKQSATRHMDERADTERQMAEYNKNPLVTFKLQQMHANNDVLKGKEGEYTPERIQEAQKSNQEISQWFDDFSKTHGKPSVNDKTMPENQHFGDMPRGTRPPGDDITIRFLPSGEPVYAKPDPNNKGKFLQVTAKTSNAQPMGESAPSPNAKIVPTPPPSGTNLTDASSTLPVKNEIAGVSGNEKDYQGKTMEERIKQFTDMGFNKNEAKEMAELEMDEERTGNRPFHSDVLEHQQNKDALEETRRNLQPGIDERGRTLPPSRPQSKVDNTRAAKMLNLENATAGSQG